MNTLEHARVYIDLPKHLQDDDALVFARAVVSLYEIIDRPRSPVGGYPATRVEFAMVVNAGIRGDLPPTEFQIQRLRSNNKRRKDCSSSGHA